MSLRRLSAAAAAALVLAATALAQGPADSERFPMGYNADAEDIPANTPTEQLKRGFLPEEVDLSASFPTPQQQLHDSCTAWATGYAARSYYARMEGSGNRSDDSATPSPAYIYNQTYDRSKPCEKAGSIFAHAFKLLQNAGAPSRQQYPDAKTCRPEAGLPGADPRFKILGIRELVKERRTASGRVAQPANLDVVRQSLAEGHPVIFSMQVGPRFMQLRGSEVYTGSVVGTPDSKGSHAMTLTGYDDRRGAVRVINSWSTKWADGGFGWISYATFRADANNAYRMVLANEPPKPQPGGPVAEIPPDIAKELGTLECSDVRTAAGEKPRLTGFVSEPAVQAKLRKLAEEGKIVNEVALRPWPVCEALLTLREPMRAASVPKAATKSGSTIAKVGSTISFTITPPNFPAFLYAVYLQADGKVVNLMPRRGAMRPQVRPELGSQPIAFGDGQDGRPTFRVTKPTGHEALIVLAARSPIAELEALEATDGAFFQLASASRDKSAPQDRLFLSILRSGMLARPEQGALAREIAADVLHITIEE